MYADGVVYDSQSTPGACTPYSNGTNIVAANRLNAAALNYFNAFPLPNVPGTVNGTENNYQTVRNNISHGNNFDVRADANFGENDRAFFRFIYGGRWQLNTIVTAETGTPFPVIGAQNYGDTYSLRANQSRPYPMAHSVLGQPSLLKADFSAPAPATEGNTGRNAFYGPGIATRDVRRVFHQQPGAAHRLANDLSERPLGRVAPEHCFGSA